MAASRADGGGANGGAATSLPLLGVPVRFEADAARALVPIEAAYGVWAALDGRPELASPSGTTPSVVRVELAAEGGAETVVWPPTPRMDRRGRLLLRSDGIAAFADARRSEAWCRVARALLDDVPRYLDLVATLALWLVGHRDRQPVHGVTVAHGGVGLVLTASSGTGKSTLAYAALRGGLRVLDDDVAYVQLEPRLRVWGRSERIHLAPDVAARFADLAGRDPIERPNGKRRVPVALPAPGADGVWPAVEPVGLCLLERGSERATLEAVEPDRAVSRVLDDLDGGFEAYRGTIGRRVRRLAERGAWRLRLSDDPAEGVARVRALLDASDG